jgi:hypothetical protein
MLAKGYLWTATLLLDLFMTASATSKPKKVLFILKRRTPYYDIESNTYTTSSGLANSARFVVDMLVASGVSTVIEEVTDNNDIDRVVTKHRPTHVVIEALWVVPEKFTILHKLHPTVQWIVRYHSEISFLSQEGIAMEWTFGYMNQPKVSIALNSDRTHRDMVALVSTAMPMMQPQELAHRVLYLPNYYPTQINDSPYRLKHKSVIDVGCFGAIRPLKNQLPQAVAAITFAETHELGLRFHINGDRVQQKGDTVLKNIRKLFEALPPWRFQLIEHPWLSHESFIKLVRQMDIGLQVSFTETFNIVSADMVSNGIPVVTSNEIVWVAPQFQSATTDVADIVAKMENALKWKRFGKIFSPNENGLRKYSGAAKTAWLKHFS